MKVIIFILCLIGTAYAQPMRFFTGAMAQYPPIVKRGLTINVDAGVSTSYNNSLSSFWNFTNNSSSLSFVGSSVPSFSTSNNGSLLFNGTNQGAYYYNASGAVQIPFTVNLWFKLNNSNSCNIFDFKTNQSFTPLTWIRMSTSSNKYIELVNNGGSISTISIPTAFTIGVWYNVCVTVTSSTISLYENGTLLQSTANSTFSSLSGFNYAELAYISGYTLFMSANISSYSVYNVELNTTEITQNFNALRSRYNL
jgi:hypothetical protein